MKKLLLLLGLTITLCGCSLEKQLMSKTSNSTSTSDTSNASYENLMQKAKEAIVEKEFEKAEGFVELALENKKDDKVAKIYQKQLEHYIHGLSEKEDNIEAARGDFEDVTKISDGSDQLVKYAKDEIAQLGKTSQKDEKRTVETNVQEASSLWDPQKDVKLYNFMQSWGDTMKQNYKQYNERNSVDLYGLKLPEAVLENRWTMAVNRTPVSVEWSTNGDGDKEYELVAVYSDADTQPYLGKHVYFFAFQNGQPKVFVTQQNQGNPDNYIYFRESENEDLVNGFYNIANN